MNDNRGIEGKFFLGSGTVKDEIKYSYIIKTEKGYVSKSICAKNGFIRFTDEEPHLELQTYSSGELAWFWTFGLGNREEYIFYIPDGSVIQTYNIDLE